MGQNDGDLNIHVKTTADGRGLDQTKKDLAGLKGEAEKLGGGRSGGGGGVLGALSGGFGKLAGALGVVTFAIAGAKKALAEYGEAQRGVFQLDSALRQQGLLLDNIREKYQGIASARQAATAISDEEYVRSLARLTQFGVRPEQMEEVLQVVEDLAGVMNGDLRGATDAVTKALGGSWAAFGRLGIIIPENATEMEKWIAMAKQARDIGAGQLEAAVSGLEGGFKKLKNSISDTFEAFGGLIAASGVLDTPLKSLQGRLNKLTELFGGVIPKAAGMENIFARTKLTTEQSADAAERYAKSLKAISEASEKAAKNQAAELRALDDLKEAEEQQAKAKLERDIAHIKALEKEKKLSPERAEKIVGELERGAKEADFQRDQRYRGAGIQTRERLIGTEDARIKQAEAAVAKAEGAVKDDKNVQAEFDRLTGPLNAELTALRKKSKDFLDSVSAHGGQPWLAKKISPDYQEIERQIKEKEAALTDIQARFKSDTPPVNPALEKNVTTARKNLEDVRKSANERKLELQEGVGRERMHFDSARGARQFERQTEMIDSQGSWAAGLGANREVISAAARDTVTAFQQYSKESITNQRDMQKAFIEAIREIQNLKRDYETLRQQSRQGRNK